MGELDEVLSPFLNFEGPLKEWDPHTVTQYSHVPSHTPMFMGAYRRE